MTNGRRLIWPLVVAFPPVAEFCGDGRECANEIML